MARDMVKWKAAQRRWYLEVVIPRRKKWFKENGPCVDCGSWERLELDHQNPLTKVGHNIWSWSDKPRLAELAKCRPRCHGCHLEKTKREYRERDLAGALRVIDPLGQAWCYAGRHFMDIDAFTKNRAKRRGIQNECRQCRSTKRSPKHAAEANTVGRDGL